MKYRISILLLVGISIIGNASSKPAASGVRIDIHGQRDGIVLKPDSSDSTIRIYNMATKKTEWSGKIINAFAPVDSDWRKFKIAFTPDKDGSVNMLLRGKYNKDGKQVWTLYDDISIEGASIKNGDFEKGIKSWRFGYCGPKNKRKKPGFSDDAKSGATSIKVSHNNNVYQKLIVTAGKKVVITFWAKAAKIIKTDNLKEK